VIDVRRAISCFPFPLAWIGLYHPIHYYGSVWPILLFPDLTLLSLIKSTNILALPEDVFSMFLLNFSVYLKDCTV
jgi:hypothetical protein